MQAYDGLEKKTSWAKLIQQTSSFWRSLSRCFFFQLSLSAFGGSSLGNSRDHEMPPFFEGGIKNLMPKYVFWRDFPEKIARCLGL